MNNGQKMNNFMITVIKVVKDAGDQRKGGRGSGKKPKRNYVNVCCSLKSVGEKEQFQTSYRNKNILVFKEHY